MNYRHLPVFQTQPTLHLEVDRLNHNLQLVRECNEILVRANSEHELLSSVIHRLATHGKYPQVWVGLLSLTEARNFDVSMCASDCNDGLVCSWLEHSKSIAGEAIRTRRQMIFRDDPAGTPCTPPCPITAAGRTLTSIALPLIVNGDTLGCLNISSHANGAFRPQEIELLQELADDLAFGLGALRERTLHQRAENRLRLLERAVAASANAIIVTDAIDGKHPILHINPAFERITGYTATEVIGQNSRFLLGNETGQSGLIEIRSALREKREGRALLKNFRKDGSMYWNELTVAPVPDEHGEVTHFISVMNDVTAHKMQEEQIARHAHYDALTGLPNRSLLFERIRRTVAATAEHGNSISVLLIALNRFALVNDAYGHDAGDELLRMLAMRLLAMVRPRDTVARLGGDEFVVLLSDLSNADDTLHIIEKIYAGILVPFPLSCAEVVISASIGVTLYPRDGGDAESLIRNAEVAALEAKTCGLKAFRFYAEDMNRRTSERLEMEFDLRRALDHQEFEVYYQPIIDLASGRIVEAEALLRWHRPQHGMVLPDKFIPLAEDTGLIVPIGSWVLNEACRQNAVWREANLAPISVAVNLSGRQFSESRLEDLVAEVLAANGLDGSALILEVTESMLMSNIDESVTTLHKLKQLGVHLSLDDFGTGYSSLAYLKRLPLDTLKIDRSFVCDIATDPNDAAIAVTVISMARTMNLGVIAEGVETEAQVTYLHNNSCERIQGYLFSPPVCANDLGIMLRNQKRLEKSEMRKVCD